MKKKALLLCCALVLTLLMLPGCARVKCLIGSHEWNDADCVTPKTCSVCGETEGKALGHSWVDATCTTPKTCSVCEETEGKALGHSWVDATCITPKTCSTCKITEGAIIDHLYENGYCTMCNAKDPVYGQLEIGQEIYSKLNAVNIISEIQASQIYDAWYFAIYKADDDKYLYDYTTIIKDFSSYVGISQSEVTKAIDQYLRSLGLTPSAAYRWAVLGTNDGAVNTVLIANENSGIYTSIESTLEEVKSLLKEMDTNYAGETYLSVLKDYYTHTTSYYNFVSSPTGSFSNLSTTLNGYTSKLSSCINELSFVYDK